MADKKRFGELSSALLVTTNDFVKKLETFANETKLDFDEDARRCVTNGMSVIHPMIQRSNWSINQFDVNNLVAVLRRTAFLKLDATNGECFYQIRRVEVKGNWIPTIEFGIQGVGNDRILKEYGEGVDEVKSYIVYEGDEFTDGYMDGWDVKLPTYKRTRKTNKPILAVYLIKKTNGEIDVSYGVLEDVKKSLLANAKQNGASDSLLREINKQDLYSILEDEKWLNYKIDKGKYKTPLFNPSYTSPISMYNMIERKLRNHATRKYPKNFNNKTLAEIYEETYEDEKYRDGKFVVNAEHDVEKAQLEFEEESGKTDLFKEDKRQEEKPLTDIEVHEEGKGETLIVESEEEVYEETGSAVQHIEDLPQRPAPKQEETKNNTPPQKEESQTTTKKPAFSLPKR